MQLRNPQRQNKLLHFPLKFFAAFNREGSIARNATDRNATARNATSQNATAKNTTTQNATD